MKKLFFITLIGFVFISCASIGKPEDERYVPEYYYQLGCEALSKENTKQAEKYFFEALYSSLNFIDKSHLNSSDSNFKETFSTQAIRYDIENAKENSSKANGWVLYYLKGVLESNKIYDYRTSTVCPSLIISINTNNALKSLEKSLELYDSYQVHIALSQVKNEDDSQELDKAIQLAVSTGNKSVASKIEYGRGCVSEYKDQLENALTHFNNSLNYSWTEEANKAKNRIEKAITLLPKVKEEGFSSYSEYEKYHAQETKRKSWENLYIYLTLGNYGNSIPLQKGDIIEIPNASLILLNVDVANSGYLYLFSAVGYNQFSKCSYLVSANKLPNLYINGTGNVIQKPLKIECQGTMQYRRGVSVENGYMFRIVEE